MAAALVAARRGGTGLAAAEIGTVADPFLKTRDGRGKGLGRAGSVDKRLHPCVMDIGMDEVPDLNHFPMAMAIGRTLPNSSSRRTDL